MTIEQKAHKFLISKGIKSLHDTRIAFTIEQYLVEFAESLMDKSECHLIHEIDTFMECYITSCCEKGPIINEKYCSNCGSKINNIVVTFADDETK